MKPKTRDNLIYLGVGLSIAAGLTMYMFYTERTTGTFPTWHSNFAVRAVYSTALIWYVVIKVMHDRKQTFLKALAAILFATALHLTIVLASRQVIEQLPGLAFTALFALEAYLVLQVTEKLDLYLTRSQH